MLVSIRKVFVALLSIVALLVVGLLSTVRTGLDQKMFPKPKTQLSGQKKFPESTLNKSGLKKFPESTLNKSDGYIPGIHIEHVNRLRLYTNTSDGVVAHFDQVIPATPYLTMAQILESRRVGLEKTCAKEFNGSVQTRGRPPAFFYSRSTKLVCCKAPKTGSSFWGTVILAIESKKSAEDIFHINRNSVHGKNEIGMGQLRNVSKDTLKLMVSREPYSRLFSAYVDKYFLLGALGRGIQHALKKGPFKMNGGICGYDVSFADFLNFVTDKALQGADLNEHFLPVVKLCDPCRIKYDIVSRQESLTKDTQHVLDLLKFSDTKKKDIQNALHKGIKNTIYSLVASYLSDYRNYQTDCPDRVNHFEKVWKTLQVQGYVSTKVAYPKHEFQKMLTFDPNAITLLILKEIERSPLGKEEKRFQRQSAISIAYSDVGPEIIAKIQKVYKMDFLMFGYDMTPPDKRPGAVIL